MFLIPVNSRAKTLDPVPTLPSADETNACVTLYFALHCGAVKAVDVKCNLSLTANNIVQQINIFIVIVQKKKFLRSKSAIRDCKCGT